MNKIEKLKELINCCNNIVVLTGAGVSTGSGIKDFRSNNGLSNNCEIPIEILLSHDYFFNNTKDFYKFYKMYFDCSKAKPNIVHKYLKELEDKGKVKAIITQNIDGLHSKAGSKKVFEIHGTTCSNYCVKCNKKYDSDYIFNNDDIPICSCGGLVKPDVVLYGEQLPKKELEESIKYIQKADMLLVLGTSLVVYPAAGLIDYFFGKNLIIINNDKTPYDRVATLVINDDLSKVFECLEKKGM